MTGVIWHWLALEVWGDWGAMHWSLCSDPWSYLALCQGLLIRFVGHGGSGCWLLGLLGVGIVRCVPSFLFCGHIEGKAANAHLPHQCIICPVAQKLVVNVVIHHHCLFIIAITTICTTVQSIDWMSIPLNLAYWPSSLRLLACLCVWEAGFWWQYSLSHFWARVPMARWVDCLWLDLGSFVYVASVALLLGPWHHSSMLYCRVLWPLDLGGLWCVCLSIVALYF